MSSPRSGMRARGRRRWVAALALVAAIATAATGIARLVAPDRPVAGDTVAEYVRAWSRGDDRAAAALTTRPRLALEAMRMSRQGLDAAQVQATVVSVREAGRRATARVRARWSVPRFGRFAYDVRIPLERRSDGEWAIRWRSTALHPRLDVYTRLGTAVTEGPRGGILDRHGRALVRDRPVVDLSLQARRVRDPERAAAQLVAVIADVDPDVLASRLRGADRGRHVPVITLRADEHARIAAQLEGVAGLSVAERRAPLAPTRGFARAVLGSVGPATAEQLERLGSGYSPGDVVGQWGLQARFEKRLAGTPTRQVVIRGVPDGAVLDVLEQRQGRDGRPVRTTLDRDVQAAAERALDEGDGNAALVALKPSTGDVLAVANRPLDSTLNRAFEGLYPPGSTFKVVSTAALLATGLDKDETVPCPPTVTVDGRSFRNFEGDASGVVPFTRDFAESCNTAFVSLAPRLSAGALKRTGRLFGLGRPLKPALPAADGSVPVPEDPVRRAAMMIGQDQILASPLQMAAVAATVADGRWRAPRLTPSDPVVEGPPVPPAQVQTLRELMRAVVTSGTGTALASVAEAPSGKSGTAEYGTGDPPPTHAWFIAFRNDIAVAVLVEDGRSGGSVAAPVVARFLAALG